MTQLMMAIALAGLVASNCNAEEATHYSDLTGLLYLPYDAEHYDVVKTGGATFEKVIFTTKGTRSDWLYLMVVSKIWTKPRTSNENADYVADFLAPMLTKEGFVYLNEVLPIYPPCTVRRFILDDGKPTERSLYLIVGTNDKGYCAVYWVSESGDARIDTNNTNIQTAYLFFSARDAMLRPSSGVAK
jgi:hypothetical protein